MYSYSYNEDMVFDEDPAPSNSRHTRRPLIVKLCATAALVVSACLVAGFGTFGTFTSATNASQTVQSGLVSLQIGAVGTSANRLDVAATGLVAGDTVERAVDLMNSGNTNLSSITLDTVASASSLLDTDTINGLQTVIDSCSAPWTEGGSFPAYTYTCSGSSTVVAPSMPAVVTGLALTGLASASPGGVDHLRVVVTLPSSANNSFQGLTSQLDYTFTAVQRTATSM